MDNETKNEDTEVDAGTESKRMSKAEKKAWRRENRKAKELEVKEEEPKEEEEPEETEEDEETEEEEEEEE